MVLRPIAFHLPQFHPIPENDEWWGKGFTEWTNVTKAKPLFKGHNQPHLPADLGFYDLRLPEVRLEQARLAKEYGIYGFCYFHYWFNGKKLLEMPAEEILRTGKPDFPFMFCWANENWTRIWESRGKEVLIEQSYSESDDIAHINYLIPFFQDDRYIKVQGKPVMAIYRSTSIPNLKQTLQTWRREAAAKGIELYICRVESPVEYGPMYLSDGIDAAIEFEPNSKKKVNFKNIIRKDFFENKLSMEYLFFKASSSKRQKKILHQIEYWYNYKEYVDYQCSLEWDQSYKKFPCLTPMWDNTARRGKDSFLFYNSTPQDYQRWLSYIVKKFKPYDYEENFIFINAWNEWAEGNHLEPCRKWGLGYLEATRKGLKESF